MNVFVRKGNPGLLRTPEWKNRFRLQLPALLVPALNTGTLDILRVKILSSRSK
jgi:hypothetical protein